MIHPDTEIRFISPEKGYGVVATRFIPRGTLTWVQDELDRCFSPAEVGRLSAAAREAIEKFAFTNARGQKVLCWDNGKYVNHSFRPNCMSTAYDFEFAARDIHPGEELTDDYGYLNIERPFEPVDEGGPRKIVYPDDILRCYPMWDSQLLECAEAIASVFQPLAPYGPQNWEAFARDLRLGGGLRSMKECYYDGTASGRINGSRVPGQ